MVKLINPFGGISAHGKFGGLVYQLSKYGQVVRVHTPQKKRPTEKQLLQNYFFGIVCDNWRVLSDWDKYLWERRAKPWKMTGFNFYVKLNIQHAWIAYYGIAKYGVSKYS